MNTSIRPQQPKFTNTVGTQNQRDSVYKMGPIQAYNFYELYNEIMLILEPISTYQNNTIIEREFSKIKKHCATIIQSFFIPSLSRVSSDKNYQLTAEEFHNNLDHILKTKSLETIELIPVSETPVPTDIELLSYCKQFLSFILKLCSESKVSKSEGSSKIKFKKPHMLGMTITSTEDEKKFKHELLKLNELSEPEKSFTQYHRKQFTLSSFSFSEENVLR